MSSLAPSARPPASALAVVWFNKTIVSLYKLVGFVLLTVILLGLVSYIGLHSAYFLHRSWLAPAIVSPGDPRVLEMRARLAQESWMRQKVVADRSQVELTLRNAERTIQAELAFQEQFKKAVAADAKARQQQLWNVTKMHQKLRDVHAEAERTSEAFSLQSKERMQEQYQAHLIDRDSLVGSAYQLDQIATSSLARTQRQSELQQHEQDLQREVSALGQLAKTPESSLSSPLTYDALAIARQFQQSILTMRNAEDQASEGKKAIQALNEQILGYEKMLQVIREAPLFVASEHAVTVAFVPYENSANIRPNATVYGCDLYILWCRPIGHVKSFLPGEVKVPHPLYGHELRGELVELELNEASWAQTAVLHANRPPLFF